MTEPPRITVWSDYICPFCYAGTALATWLQQRYRAEIEWRPFDLHPELPPEGIPMSVLERRVGPEAQAGVRAMIASAGLPHSAVIERIPNSSRALALAELARDRGLHDQVHTRLFAAYWARGADLHDVDVLIAEGEAAGLAADEIRVAIDDPGYLARIAQQTHAASELGIGGVPGWIIDERLLVPGAQPHEVFDQVMETLGHAPLAA